MASIVDTLLQLLEKDVVDNSKMCAEYFEFFKNYASYVSSNHFGPILGREGLLPLEHV